MEGRQRPQIHVEQHIAIDDQYVFTNPAQGRQASGRAERAVLNDHLYIDGQAAAFGKQGRLQDIAPVTGQDRDMPDPLPRECRQLAEYDRHAAHGQQRLRDRVAHQGTGA